MLGIPRGGAERKLTPSLETKTRWETDTWKQHTCLGKCVGASLGPEAPSAPCVRLMRGATFKNETCAATHPSKSQSWDN
eukprot:4256903-Alexandrium_andersonii.AAC.2